MKVLPFTIPVSDDQTVIIKDEVLPFFYPYLHRHEEIQLTYISQGKGTLLAGNHMHPFQTGDVFLIGANIPHVFKTDPALVAGKKKKVKSLTIFFSTTGPLAPVLALPELKKLLAFFARHSSGFQLPRSSVKNIVERMLAVNHATGLDQLLQFLQLLQVISGLKNLQPLSPDSGPAGFSDQEGARIREIYSYVIQHYTRLITLEEVAALAHMTPHSFCRYFKKHTGINFIAFVNKMRIHEACKQMLERSFDSISAVAYNCGFSNVTSFNRVFRMYMNESPRQYTKRFQNTVGSNGV